MALGFASRTLRALRRIFSDALYRGSLTLLANTAAISVIGLIFWTLAAHRYPASALGVYSSVTSGSILLATIAALGLPLTMTRYIASTENPRALVIMAVTVIATVGTTLCLVIVLALGPHLPAALHLQQHGRLALLVTVLVVFTAMGGTLNARLGCDSSKPYRVDQESGGKPCQASGNAAADQFSVIGAAILLRSGARAGYLAGRRCAGPQDQGYGRRIHIVSCAVALPVDYIR